LLNYQFVFGPLFAMSRKLRILIIEDEAAIRNGLIDVFVYHGYEVDFSGHGVDGLNKALTGKFDLILLDVMLPGLNGFEICNRIREQDRDQAIIMLTAKSNDELTNRINNHLIRLINIEEQRPFTDYSFLNVEGASTANFLQRSPLSRYPFQSEIPGLIGYFQVDAAGKLLTPFILENIEKAASYGIAEQELSARIDLQNRIQLILNENRLVRNQTAITGKLKKDVHSNSLNKPDSGLAEREKDALSSGESTLKGKLEKSAASPASEGQAAFDELNKISPGKSQQENKLGRLEDVELRQSFEVKAVKPKLAETKENITGNSQKKTANRTKSIARRSRESKKTIRLYNRKKQPPSNVCHSA
jgi:CheY-like chemotaxis protein